MSEKDDLDSKLIDLLTKINFSKRYYDYYEKHRMREGNEMPSASKEVYEKALGSTSLDFDYKKKENFFSHIEEHGTCSITLNIAFRDSAAEFILAVKNGDSVAGGPFHELAYDAGQVSDPDFEPDPPYPTLPFSTADELQEVVEFGIGLFEDSKALITKEKAFNCG